MLRAQGAYREAVTSQSPGLLQPWVMVVGTSQPQRGCVSGRNPFRVEHKTSLPRVEATLGFET